MNCLRFSYRWFSSRRQLQPLCQALSPIRTTTWPTHLSLTLKDPAPSPPLSQSPSRSQPGTSPLSYPKVGSVLSGIIIVIIRWYLVLLLLSKTFVLSFAFLVCVFCLDSSLIVLVVVFCSP